MNKAETQWSKYIGLSEYRGSLDGMGSVHWSYLCVEELIQLLLHPTFFKQCSEMMIMVNVYRVLVHPSGAGIQLEVSGFILVL